MSYTPVDLVASQNKTARQHHPYAEFTWRTVYSVVKVRFPKKPRDQQYSGKTKPAIVFTGFLQVF
jgi:hypothetical protein